MSHGATEVIRVGPGPYLTQWPLERTIGDLGQQVKQPSNPYANLSQRGIRQAQVNALKAMVPDLDPDKSAKLPQGSIDLGNGYVLLQAMDTTYHSISDDEVKATRNYLHSVGFTGQINSIIRWARIRLPNGQIARSRWKESLKPLDKVRMSRNVKVCCIYSDSIHKTLIEFFDFSLSRLASIGIK